MHLAYEVCDALEHVRQVPPGVLRQVPEAPAPHVAPDGVEEVLLRQATQTVLVEQAEEVERKVLFPEETIILIFKLFFLCVGNSILSFSLISPSNAARLPPCAPSDGGTSATSAVSLSRLSPSDRRCSLAAQRASMVPLASSEGGEAMPAVESAMRNFLLRSYARKTT